MSEITIDLREVEAWLDGTLLFITLWILCLLVSATADELRPDRERCRREGDRQ